MPYVPDYSIYSHTQAVVCYILAVLTRADDLTWQRDVAGRGAFSASCLLSKFQAFRQFGGIIDFGVTSAMLHITES